MNLRPNTQLLVHIGSPRDKEGFMCLVFIDSFIETELTTLKLLYKVQYTVEVKMGRDLLQT